ncbi:MAG: universal stress protein [Acidobacteria bacterium]|nr:universal stress protein [Acidobacteriota bacterium]MBU4494777.1 universal stress protein [Acidobacteriota bacterium]
MAKFLNKILWATDFSDESLDSLSYAKIFADTFKAKISALHVAPDFSPALYDTVAVIQGELSKRVAAFKSEARIKLEDIQKTRGIVFDIILSEGNASKKIIETAEEIGADLIVMGSKGLSAIEKLFIGSVANHVVRNTSVPLLLTKKGRRKPSMKKILVPTDFSEQEDIERDYAWKLAKGFDSALMFLHVLELHDYEFPPKILDKMMDAVLDKLKARRKKEHEDIVLKEDVTRAINASLGIADYAQSNKYDLIVISTCVQSKIERFFLGSTTEKVIAHSQVPIFAIPPERSGK